MKKALALLLCALLLAGCTAEEAPYVPTGDGLTSEEATVPSGTPITEQAVSLAYYPGRSLNPYRCVDYTNRMLFGLLYQGLFAVDEDYRADPILCSGYSVSGDMKTYTFYLEQATFSDGTALTAADAAASLRAAVDSDYYGGRFGYVERIATADDAVVVTLTTPYEDFPVLLDVPIVKADQVGADRPLGTGPYHYESVDGGLALCRRTDWWCVAALPLTAQKIALVEGESTSQLRDAFEFEQLSLVCADPGSENYVDFHSDYELWDAENGIFLYLGSNARSDVLSRGQIRANLTYAIDRAAIVTDYYRGFAQAAVLPASPRSPYYSAVLAEPVSYDPERLTSAVAQTGLQTNELVLLVNNDDGIRLRVARAIANSLNACGLTVTVSALAGDAYREALAEGSFDLYLGQTKLSANMDLSAFFAPEGALSFGSISDPVTYALCQESLANSGNFYTLQKSILESGAITPILFRSYAIFAQRGLLSASNPARDAIFYYTLGKRSEDIRIEVE